MEKFYQPTLVIGLGGTGKKILLALKKLIAENSPGGMTDFPLLRMISLDTDVKIDPAKSTIETIAGRDLELDPNKEVFSLHGDYVGYPQLESFPEINSWYPQSLLSGLESAALKTGAGMRKPIGRFALAWNAPALHSRLETLLSNQVDTELAQKRNIGPAQIAGYTNVFICGSVCGGTGAGAFIDVAYLVKYIAKSQSRQVYTYGMLALSSLFDGMQGNLQIRPNCYASLMELDHFSNPAVYMNPYQRMRPQYKNYFFDFGDATATPPFNYPFVFDRTNDMGLSYPSDTAFADMCARFIHLMNGHQVAASYQSMDNNVRARIETRHGGTGAGKPSIYRSVGVHSVLFPRRVVSQACSYLMAGAFLDRALADTASSTEVRAFTDGWLVDLGLRDDLLDQRFGQYRDASGRERSFSDYVAEVIETWEAPADRKDLSRELRALTRDLVDRDLGQFTKQAENLPRDEKNAIDGRLSAAIAELSDICPKVDRWNPDLVRWGSWVLVVKVLADMGELLESARDKARADRERFSREFESARKDLEDLVVEIEEKAQSLLSFGGGVKALKDEYIERLGIAMDLARQAVLAKARFQLLNQIEDRNVVLGPGMITSVQEARVRIDGLVTAAREVQKTIRTFNEGNRTYSSGSFTTILFDYERDVLRTYQDILAARHEASLLPEISSTLKSKLLGASLGKSSTYHPASLRVPLLSACEEIFREPVNSINIEDIVFDDPELTANLSKNVYQGKAGVFAVLDGHELAKANLSLDDTTFHAIAIPDDYEGRPCAALRGLNSLQAQCPVDRDPDHYRNQPDNGCVKHSRGRCLKRLLMNNGQQGIAIMPTDDIAEINILKAKAGFPLHALVTAINACKPAYQQLRDNMARDPSIKDERLHMFGSIKIPDLQEAGEDMGSRLKSFRCLLMIAAARERLQTERLSVRFMTEEDLHFERAQGSLQMGKGLEDCMVKAQSNKREDIAMVDTFMEEMNLQIERILNHPQNKESMIEKIKAFYLSIQKTDGSSPFSLDDAALLDEYSTAVFGSPLKVRQYRNIDA